MKWFSLRTLFSPGYRRAQQAELRLVLAYRNVFNGSADAQIVLADLANFTGFYRVNGFGIPPDDRAHTDGMRAAFGRLFRFLNLTDEELSALAQSAREEALVSSQEGEI